VIFHDIGLINTLGALIVPQLTSALGIYLMYSFFQSFPRELEEAGRIDGCSRLQVFWKIVLPLARPALAALGIITFIYAWNDLFWPLIAITSSRTFTVQVGLTTFQGEHSNPLVAGYGRHGLDHGAGAARVRYRPAPVCAGDHRSRQGMTGSGQG
jgi:ABC-type sugar transport system, permease component